MTVGAHQCTPELADFTDGQLDMEQEDAPADLLRRKAWLETTYPKE
jgi:hypothetical protein